jgi:hypothetical protein
MDSDVEHPATVVSELRAPRRRRAAAAARARRAILVRMVVRAVHRVDASDGALLEPLAQPGERGLEVPILEDLPDGRVCTELAQDAEQPERRLDARRHRLLRQHVLARAQRRLDRRRHHRDGQHDQHGVDFWVGKHGLHLGMPTQYALRKTRLHLGFRACHALARSRTDGHEAHDMCLTSLELQQSRDVRAQCEPRAADEAEP